MFYSRRYALFVTIVCVAVALNSARCFLQSNFRSSNRHFRYSTLFHAECKGPQKRECVWSVREHKRKQFTICSFTFKPRLIVFRCLASGSCTRKPMETRHVKCVCVCVMWDTIVVLTTCKLLCCFVGFYFEFVSFVVSLEFFLGLGNNALHGNRLSKCNKTNLLLFIVSNLYLLNGHDRCQPLTIECIHALVARSSARDKFCFYLQSIGF